MQDKPTERQRQYREVYLRSDHWRATRLAALERAGNRCQVCNADKRLDVHHRTYERIGNERPEDLTVLCRGCHELYHESRRRTPKRSKPSRRVPQKRSAAETLKTLREVARGLNTQGEYTVRGIASIAELPVGLVGSLIGDLVNEGLLWKPSKTTYRRPVDQDAAPRTLQRSARARAALRVRCPACDAAPGVACPMGGVHMVRLGA